MFEMECLELFSPSAADLNLTVLYFFKHCVYYLYKYLICLCRDLPVSTPECKYFNSVNAQLQTGPTGSAIYWRTWGLG